MEGYPKTLYPRVGGGSIVVESPEQEKRLGEGWMVHPPFPVVPEPKRRGRPPKPKEEPVEVQ